MIKKQVSAIVKRLAVACLFAAFPAAAQTNPVPASQTLYCVYAQTWNQCTNAGLALVTSPDLGETWSPPITVVTNSMGWSANHAFGVTSSGRLVCIFESGQVSSGSATNIAVVFSDDGGQTWNNGVIPDNRVWSATNEWNYTGRSDQPISPAPYGQIRQVGNTLFAGAYQEWTVDSSASYVLISTNNGFSWYPHLINFTNFFGRVSGDVEPEILPVTTHLLLAGIRHKVDSVNAAQTILSLAGSTDGGLTWTNLGWIPTANAYSAQNPVGLNLFQAADGSHVFMAYGDRGATKLYVSQAPLNQVWHNPAVLYSNRVAVGSISGSWNADGGYASALNLDNNGNFFVSYYYAPFPGGYIPADLTNASVDFIKVALADSGFTNITDNNMVTNLPNQYPYEAFPVLAVFPTNADPASLDSTNSTAAITLPLILAPISNQTVMVGTMLTITNSVVGPDGDQLTFSLSPDAPTNACINITNGVFSWMPDLNQIGNTTFTVMATDDSQPSPITTSPITTQSFIVTVTNNNSGFVGLTTPPVRLSWNYPADALSTNLFFVILQSTNLSLPITQWSILTNIIGTNLSISIPTQFGQCFFAVTTSDSSDDSDSSDGEFNSSLLETNISIDDDN